MVSAKIGATSFARPGCIPFLSAFSTSTIVFSTHPTSKKRSSGPIKFVQEDYIRCLTLPIVGLHNRSFSPIILTSVYRFLPSLRPLSRDCSFGVIQPELTDHDDPDLFGRVFIIHDYYHATGSVPSCPHREDVDGGDRPIAFNNKRLFNLMAVFVKIVDIELPATSEDACLISFTPRDADRP